MSQSPDVGQVPPDFPRRADGALAGVQPKLAARLIGGKVVVGETAEELVGRYEACRDLAEQVTESARRKRPQYADLTLREFLRRLRKGVVAKGWDLDPQELDWLMRQVAVGLGGRPEEASSEDVQAAAGRVPETTDPRGTADDAPIAERQIVAPLAPPPPAAPVESVVDRALKALKSS